MQVLSCPKGIFSSLSRCFALIHTNPLFQSKVCRAGSPSLKKSHNWGDSFWKGLVCHIGLILQQDWKSIRKGGCMEYSLDSVLIWPYLCVCTVLVIVKWSSQSLANSAYHHIHNSGQRTLWFKFRFMLKDMQYYWTKKIYTQKDHTEDKFSILTSIAEFFTKAPIGCTWS